MGKDQCLLVFKRGLLLDRWGILFLVWQGDEKGAGFFKRKEKKHSGEKKKEENAERGRRKVKV